VHVLHISYTVLNIIMVYLSIGVKFFFYTEIQLFMYQMRYYRVNYRYEMNRCIIIIVHNDVGNSKFATISKVVGTLISQGKYLFPWYRTGIFFCIYTFVKYFRIAINSRSYFVDTILKCIFLFIDRCLVMFIIIVLCVIVSTTNCI
jgi:hypothetical protein